MICIFPEKWQNSSIRTKLKSDSPAIIRVGAIEFTAPRRRPNLTNSCSSMLDAFGSSHYSCHPSVSSSNQLPSILVPCWTSSGKWASFLNEELRISVVRRAGRSVDWWGFSVSRLILITGTSSLCVQKCRSTSEYSIAWWVRQKYPQPYFFPHQPSTQFHCPRRTKEKK